MEIKIYLITNRINGKQYVGQTSRTIEQRFNEHASCRRTAIDKAIAKYGRENFTVEELETCDTIEQANEREQYWIAFYGCMAPKGYNLTTGGKSNASKPCRHLPNTARKRPKAELNFWRTLKRLTPPWQKSGATAKFMSRRKRETICRHQRRSALRRPRGTLIW